MARFRHSNRLSVAVGLAVTLVCITLAVWDVAGGRPPSTVARELGGALLSAEYSLLVPFMACLAGFYGLKAWRWKLLLAHLGEYRTTRLVPSIMVGFAFNNLLPFRLGEFVRIFVAARQLCLPHVVVLASVIMERLLDVAAILAFVAFALAAVGGLDDRLSRATHIPCVLLLLAAVAIFIFVCWTSPDISRVV